MVEDGNGVRIVLRCIFLAIGFLYILYNVSQSIFITTVLQQQVHYANLACAWLYLIFVVLITWK